MAWAVFVPMPYIETSRYHAKYDSHIIFANAEVNLLRGGANKVYDPKKDPKKKFSKYRVIAGISEFLKIATEINNWYSILFEARDKIRIIISRVQHLSIMRGQIVLINELLGWGKNN